MHCLLFALLFTAMAESSSLSPADFAPVVRVQVVPTHVKGSTVAIGPSIEPGVAVVKNLDEAREASRSRKPEHQFTIELLPGIHALSTPLVLDQPEDSGVTWMASSSGGPGSASISGGVYIDGWYDCPKSIIGADDLPLVCADAPADGGQPRVGWVIYTTHQY